MKQLYIFPVGNLNIELKEVGRVGSDFLSAIAGRVESGQRFAGSGRVGSGPRKVTRGQLWLTMINNVL